VVKQNRGTSRPTTNKGIRGAGKATQRFVIRHYVREWGCPALSGGKQCCSRVEAAASFCSSSLLLVFDKHSRLIEQCHTYTASQQQPHPTTLTTTGRGRRCRRRRCVGPAPASQPCRRTGNSLLYPSSSPRPGRPVAPHPPSTRNAAGTIAHAPPASPQQQQQQQQQEALIVLVLLHWYQHQSDCCCG